MAHLNCSICKQPKNELTPKKSKLLPNVDLLVCKSCVTLGYEPRHLVIIVGRSSGTEAVKKYIDKKLYPGDDITASELLS